MKKNATSSISSSFKKSIINIIHSLSFSISATANSIFPNLIFFENLTDISQQFITYIISISYEQDEFNKICKKCSALAYSYFRDEIEALYETLIPINIDISQPITLLEVKQFHFLNQLSSFDESSFPKRSFLYFIVNLRTVELLTSIIKSVNKDGTTEVKLIFDLFFEPILKDLQHLNNSLLLLPLASKWENFFNIISNISPDETYNCMLQSISQNFYSDSQMKFILTSFRSISIKNVSNSILNSKNNLSILSSIFEYLKNKNKYSFYGSVTFFLSSIVQQLLMMQNGEFPFLAKLLTIAKSEQNIPLMTIFAIYSPNARQTINFRTISKLASDTIKTSPSNVLYSFSHFLKAFNFDVQFQLKSQELNKMISIIQSYSSTFNECQDYLTEFIVDFAFANFSSFFKDFFPILCSKDFIELNSISLFESMRLILKDQNIANQFPKEVKSIKKDLIEICYLYFLDIKENHSLVVFDAKPISDPFDILKGSDPLNPNLPSPKNFESDISVWKQQLLGNSDDNQLFELIKTRPLKTPTIISLSKSSLIHCVALSPLLGYSDKLTMAMMPLIFNESVHLASVTFRAIEAIVFLDKKKSSQILARLLSLKKCETNEHLYIMMKCALMIERTAAPNFDECLYPLIILGLCSTSYEVRNVTFQLIEFSPQTSELYRKSSKTIFDKSIQKIALILSCDSCDENSLPYHSFEEIANTNYQIIYHFFLSCFFSIVNHQLFDESRSFIFNYQAINPSALFTINLSTFLVATATNDFPSQKEFNEIISRVTTTVFEGGEQRYLLLLSFASSVSIFRADEILSILKGPNELYLHAFSLCAYFNWIRSPNEELMNKLFIHCGHIVTFCDALGYFSMTNIVTISEDLLLRRNSLMLSCLCDFSRLFTSLCDFYRDSHCQAANGPYLHRSFVGYESRLKYDSYFIFLLNLTLCQNKRLRKFAKNAFASYCAISYPSNEVMSTLIDKMPQIVEDNNNIASATSIMANSMNDKILDYFILKAKEDSRYFVCISNLFEDVKSFNNIITKLKKAASSVTNETISDDDKKFAITVFNSTGRLFALSLFYLSGDKQGNENESLKLLIHLVISTSIIHNFNKKNDSNDLNSLSFLFEFCEQKIFDNSILSFQKLNQLNDLLSDTFSFCSVSFMMESFKIGPYPLFSCFIKKWISNIEIQNNFQFYSFIKEFLKTICKKPLQPPIIDILCQIKNIDKLIIICFNLSRSCHDECLTLLFSIFSIFPKKIELLSSLFEVKFWLHCVTKRIKYQNNSNDDGDLSTKKINFNYNKDLSDYFSLTSFAKHLARKVIKTTSNTRDKLKPLLYSYSLIFDDKTNKHKLNSIQKEFFWKNCFEFGVFCGDIDCACRAIQYALNNFKESKIEYIEKVQNSLALIVDILFTFKNNNLDNLASLCTYTSLLIVFLAKLNVNLKRPQISTFQTILSFIQFSGNDAFEPILSAIIESIMIHLSFPDLKNSIEPSFFLINEIAFNGIKFEQKKMKEKKLTGDLLNSLSLLLASDFACYLSEKRELAFLSLFPYFRCNFPLFESILNFSPQFEINNSSSINEIVNKTDPKMDENDIDTLLSFYLSIFNFLSDDALLNVYEICSCLMMNGRKSNLFNDFASFLLSGNDLIKYDSYFLFLTEFQKYQMENNDETIIFNSNSASKIKMGIKTTTEFETLFFIPIYENLLQTPSEQIISCLKKVNEVTYEPFSSWEDLYMSLKKQKLDSSKIYIDDIDWKCDFDRLLKPFSSKSKSRRNSSKMASMVASYHENVNSADISTAYNPNLNLFQINLSIFTPSLDEIDEIRPDIVNFPSLC